MTETASASQKEELPQQPLTRVVRLKAGAVLASLGPPYGWSRVRWVRNR